MKLRKSIVGMAIGELLLLQGQGEPSFKLAPSFLRVYLKDGIW